MTEIHELLQLTRPLVAFDLETTSPNPQTARIVEIGFKLYTAEGLQKEWRSLVNPGMAIPPATTAVHGITDDAVKSCRNCGHRWPNLAELSGPDACTCETPFRPWPHFRNLARNLARGFSNCDFGGKNVRFDLQVLDAEMKRVNVAWSYASAHIVDAQRLETLAVPRTLADLYRKYTGQELLKAHGSLVDVAASVTVLEAQLSQHTDFPRSVEALHRLQWAEWIDVEGKFKFQEGIPICAFGKYRGVPMTEIPRGFWDWMLRGNFNDDAKALVREAKRGVYPVPPS